MVAIHYFGKLSAFGIKYVCEPSIKIIITLNTTVVINTQVGINFKTRVAKHKTEP